ncbi:MAG: PPC domain-containing protein [Verrucomicrobiota bacterium JB025]|nr:PPC domain-containing protein [Verrucomicrobiota bacterium JB025]
MNAPIKFLIAAFACQALAMGQQQYIGYVYPAGGRQGRTLEVKLGGQRLAGVHGAIVSGTGVCAELVRYERKLSPQDVRILREQLAELKLKAAGPNAKGGGRGEGGEGGASGDAMIARIEARLDAWVPRPACSALAEISYVRVRIAADAAPGRREIRLVTPRGVSNPLPFMVGQLPETTRKAMTTQALQVLGKEAASQRKRPPEEEEAVLELPCTANGQIASGEINRYRFSAKKGQQLVVTVMARELIPYIADAVPGWFQPVVTLHDGDGREIAWHDDYRYQPDPSFLFVVPEDGDYVCSIHDSIYRGREDFVYRMTIGEIPFLTGIRPLGCRMGERPAISLSGWNLNGAELSPLPDGSKPGTYSLSAKSGKLVSNPVPFEVGADPEWSESEHSPDTSDARALKLPVTVNGRIRTRHETDVYRFHGSKGQQVVAEVRARRLGSPLDSMLRITGADGTVIALCDDWEDLGSGTRTHHADSYLMCELPDDGDYFVQVSDTAGDGGEDFCYRLSVRPPRPDFELRVTPSRVSMRQGGGSRVEVHIIRKDGFASPVKLGVIDPPAGFGCWRAVLEPHMDKVPLPLKNSLGRAVGPVALRIKGTAVVGDREITREAVPAEDRMQAFLWRHLVPADDFQAVIFDQQWKPKKKPASKTK